MSASDVANDSQIFSLKALGEIVNETMVSNCFEFVLYQSWQDT